MPRQNSTNWSTGDNISATRLQQINADLDDLYSNGSDRLKVYASTGLNILIGAGVFRVGSTEWIYAGGTVAMTNNATNYVQIDSSGTIQVSTSAWNANYTRLAIVVTLSGAISSIVVWRVDAIGWVMWASGFKNISAPTYTKGLLTAFTADWTNFTLTYNKNRQVKTITNGANTWTMTYDAQGNLTATAET